MTYYKMLELFEIIDDVELINPPFSRGIIIIAVSHQESTVFLFSID